MHYRVLQIATVLEQLFPAVSLRDKITQFVDNQLFSNNANDDDARSSGFVLIRRFPKLDRESIGKYDDLMNLGLQAALNQCKTYGKDDHNRVRSPSSQLTYYEPLVAVIDPILDVRQVLIAVLPSTP